MRAEIRHEEEKEVQMLKRIKKKRMAAMIFCLYYIYVETRLKTGKRVNKSGRLYYWNTNNGAYGYF